MRTRTNELLTLLAALGLATLLVAGCGEKEDADPVAETDIEDHDHDDEMDHDHDGDAHDNAGHDHDHEHEEEPLGSTTIGDVSIEAWQSHGVLEPGKEMALVVKLPYNDNGESVVRVWIGTEDRLSSMVCKGEYAPSHDDYDIHCTAPNPLPENAQWWIEIEKPDGTKAVGSIDPLR